MNLKNNLFLKYALEDQENELDTTEPVINVPPKERLAQLVGLSFGSTAGTAIGNSVGIKLRNSTKKHLFKSEIKNKLLNKVVKNIPNRLRCVSRYGGGVLGAIAGLTAMYNIDQLKPKQ